MVFARPRSLSGRLLLGLAAISLPLLVALLLAGVQMRRMAETSERLVGEGVQATRVTQELFAQIASLERTVRLYQVITDAKLIDAYRRRSVASPNWRPSSCSSCAAPSPANPSSSCARRASRSTRNCSAAPAPRSSSTASSGVSKS